jgi:hypothetical protein
VAFCRDVGAQLEAIEGLCKSMLDPVRDTKGQVPVISDYLQVHHSSKVDMLGMSKVDMLGMRSNNSSVSDYFFA